MGRWTPAPIRVADPALGAMTVAGRFRISHPERTLSNLARLHGFQVARERGALVLRRHATDSKAS
jgi:transmembrane sensor